MKKSTCLLIGAVGVGVLCLVAVFVYVSSSIEPRGSRVQLWEGKTETLSFPPVKVVQLLQPLTLLEVREGVKQCVDVADFFSTEMEVVASETEEASFTFPVAMQPYLQSARMGDTLQVMLRFPADGRDRGDRVRYRELVAKGLRLALPASAHEVKVDWRNVLVRFEGLQRDSLSLDVLDRILLNRCSLGTLKVKADCLTLKESQAEKVYASFPERGRMKVQVEESEVQRMVYMGDRHHEVEWNAESGGELQWVPLEEGATLSVHLTQPVVLKREE